MSWYEKAFPSRPAEMPPVLKLEVGKEYVITFKEKTPRIVSGGYRRLTPVINVECQGKPYSLYLSHVDLARRILLIQKELKEEKRTLLDTTVKIHNSGKKSKRNYFYEVKMVKK